MPAKKTEQVAAVVMPDVTLLVDIETGEPLDETTRQLSSVRLAQMALAAAEAITNWERALKAIEALMRRDFGRDGVTQVKTAAGKSTLVPGSNEYIGGDDWKAWKAVHEPPAPLVRQVESDAVQAYSVAKVKEIFAAHGMLDDVETLVRRTEYDYFRHTPVTAPPPRTWPLKREQVEEMLGE